MLRAVPVLLGALLAVALGSRLASPLRSSTVQMFPGDAGTGAQVLLVGVAYAIGTGPLLALPALIVVGLLLPPRQHDGRPARTPLDGACTSAVVMGNRV